MGNSKKRCKQCKEYKPAYSGEQHPVGWYCSKTCVRDWYIATREKDTAKKLAKVKREKVEKEKAFRKGTRERKDALKTKGQWAKEAQTAFNKFIRSRDHGKPCISCGTLNPAGWDAGHFMTVGGHPELRFTEINCHRQCSSCNRGGEKYFRKAPAVAKQYEKQLRERIGSEKVDWLKGPHDPLHLSIDDIRLIKAKYNKMARELQRRIES